MSTTTGPAADGPTDPTVLARQAEVERHREELAATVDALHGKVEATKRPAAMAVGAVAAALVGVLLWRRFR